MKVKWSGRFEGYSFAHFKKDLLSGTIVGIIAVPLAMSFAIASGVKPEYGIYTAIIAGILISLLGGRSSKSAVRQVHLFRFYLGLCSYTGMKTCSLQD